MESAKPMTRKSSFAICAISWPSTPVNCGAEATQQAVGQRDGRVMLRTGGEGVDDPAGHVVRYRHGRQPGPRRQFAQHSPKIGRFIRVQGACAIQPRSARRRPPVQAVQGEPRSRKRQPKPAVTQQQAASDGGNSEQGQHQQHGLRWRLCQRCRAPTFARGADHD